MVRFSVYTSIFFLTPLSTNDRPHQLARRRTSAPRALLSYRFCDNAPPPRRSRPLLSWACAAALFVPAHQRAPPCKPSTPSIWGGLRSRLSIIGPRAGAPLEVAPPPLRFLAGSAASPKRRPACAPRHPTFWPARRRWKWILWIPSFPKN